jgi:crotonobetaine/carnitine-CoA ligase
MAPGEKEVVAAIVPSAPDRFDAQAVFDACGSRLDANAVPRFLQVLPEIPKTASEKPLERLMLEAFAVDAGNVHARG